MNYIVLDLEWNQSSTGTAVSNEKGILPFEIIEIGAVKLDKDLNKIDSFDMLVKPEVYLTMHKAIEKLLPITMNDLKKGKPFREVVNEFLNWCGRDIVFCTWGDMDLFQLQRNMNYFGVENIFPLPFLFIDLQSIFSETYLDGAKNAGLNEAVDILKLPIRHEFHRAVYDADYTADIIKKIDRKLLKSNFSIDTYKVPKKSADEFRIRNNYLEQYVTKGFNSKEKATGYRDLRKAKCFLCDRPMDRKIRWFCDNGKNYYAAFRCAEHGYITGKFRVKKSDEGKFFAVRTMTRTDEKGFLAVKDKKEKEKERAK